MHHVHASQFAKKEDTLPPRFAKVRTQDWEFRVDSMLMNDTNDGTLCESDDVADLGRSLKRTLKEPRVRVQDLLSLPSATKKKNTMIRNKVSRLRTRLSQS